MDFDTWKNQIIEEFVRVGYFDTQSDCRRYINETEDCWREMFDDGLSPRDAADEETHAAAWMGA